MHFLVAALYKFVPLPDYRELRGPLLDTCKTNDVLGTLLLAEEGINGTIAGPEAGVRNVLARLREDPRLGDLRTRESYASEPPFFRMKVSLKKEIVTMGVPGIAPARQTGTYVEPEDWNALISDPEVTVIDTRNDYEVEIGTFEGAVDPDLKSFRELPEWADRELDPATTPKVAMFCTGGIRCEKSTAYLMSRGFEEVYHLRGGILGYLEQVPEEESLWRGECFVFDQRVAVGHGLEEGTYDLCFGCRYPLSEEDKRSEHYQKGVCCARCHEATSAELRERRAERDRQVELARRRGQKHLGP